MNNINHNDNDIYLDLHFSVFSFTLWLSLWQSVLRPLWVWLSVWVRVGNWLKANMIVIIINVMQLEIYGKMILKTEPVTNFSCLARANTTFWSAHKAKTTLRYPVNF